MWEGEVSSYYACIGIEKCESHCSSDVPVIPQCSSAGQKVANTGKKNITPVGKKASLIMQCKWHFLLTFSAKQIKMWISAARGRDFALVLQ